jgi:PAS domain S-box-containing protein
MVTDVTSVKQVESALREKTEKLNGLYELSQLGIAMTDMSGRFVEFNAAFCSICGYEEHELKLLEHWKLHTCPSLPSLPSRPTRCRANPNAVWKLVWTIT